MYNGKIYYNGTRYTAMESPYCTMTTLPHTEASDQPSQYLQVLEFSSKKKICVFLQQRNTLLWPGRVT